PGSAARAARRRWRSLSFFCRRLRLAFPTSRPSAISDPEERIPPDARRGGGHAEATPINRGAPMGCYRAVPGWPYPLVLTKTGQAVHAPEGRASQGRSRPDDVAEVGVG